MGPTLPPTPSSTTKNDTRLLAIGMMAQFASRFVTVPLSILVNSLLGRKLGAGSFGELYLATTVVSLGMLLVEAGTTAQVAAHVAQDKSSARANFSAGMLLRLVLGVPLVLVIPALTEVLGYSSTMREVFLLTGLRMLLLSCALFASSIVRGFEQVVTHARLTALLSIIDALVVVPLLFFGGGLVMVLVTWNVLAAITLLVWLVTLWRMGLGRPQFDLVIAKRLLWGGLGFVAFDLATKLQPYLDARYLSSLATTESIGWFSAATRLVGTLLIPITTINFAFYPTLARLWVSDREAYLHLSRLALRAVMLFGVMAAVGAAAYSDAVIDLLYDEKGFGPAGSDLRVLSAYVLLLYGSMFLGASIAAAGRQLPWAGVQALCIPVSLVLDPILIPRFQSSHANGGLGICVSLVVSEVLMVTGGALLLPKGVLNRQVFLDLRRSLAAGLAMGASAFLLRAWPWLSMPISVGVYLAALKALGALDGELIAQLRATVSKKLSAGKPEAPAA